MDIPLAVERICPNAKWRKAGTYKELSETWLDERPLPSERDLADAWRDVLDERDLEVAKKALIDGNLAILSDKAERDKLATDARLELLIEAYLVTNSGVRE